MIPSKELKLSKTTKIVKEKFIESGKNAVNHRR